MNVYIRKQENWIEIWKEKPKKNALIDRNLKNLMFKMHVIDFKNQFNFIPSEYFSLNNLMISSK